MQRKVFCQYDGVQIPPASSCTRSQHDYLVRIRMHIVFQFEANVTPCTLSKNEQLSGCNLFRFPVACLKYCLSDTMDIFASLLNQ